MVQHTVLQTVQTGLSLYKLRRSSHKKNCQFNFVCIVILLSHIQTKIFNHLFSLSVYEDLCLSVFPLPLSLGRCVFLGKVRNFGACLVRDF